MSSASPRTSTREAARATAEVTEWDREVYSKLISTELTEEQTSRIVEPAEVYPRQRHVLAVHWHPEFVPTDVIRRRIDASFPNRETDLIIPTQHNIVTSFGAFSGVEVDCYSRSFDRKVQLLVHFARERIAEANRFRVMLAHTFRYRSHQLFEFIDTVVDSAYEARLQEAAARTGADADLVAFTRLHTSKLKSMLEEKESVTPPEAIRNKLLSNYFEALSDRFDPQLVNHACMFLRAVKKIVKRHFSNEYFYATEEIIEEVRGLGGCIIIPHPEQFWPILLADYDVDGYEVWNPQSREYTEFLINVLSRQNRALQGDRPRLLVTMGDDCHMGEKAKEPRFQDPEKAGREIGVQPAWDDLAIRKSLILADTDRPRVIEEYRQRLTA